MAKKKASKGWPRIRGPVMIDCMLAIESLTERSDMTARLKVASMPMIIGYLASSSYWRGWKCVDTAVFKLVDLGFVGWDDGVPGSGQAGQVGGFNLTDQGRRWLERYHRTQADLAWSDAGGEG